jgi:hypothetical protein
MTARLAGTQNWFAYRRGPEGYPNLAISVMLHNERYRGVAIWNALERSETRRVADEFGGFAYNQSGRSSSRPISGSFQMLFGSGFNRASQP